jgi:hypothetical protein
VTEFDFVKWLLDGGPGGALGAWFFACFFVAILVMGIGFFIFWQVLRHGLFKYQTFIICVLASEALKSRPDKLKIVQDWATDTVPGKNNKATARALIIS